MFLLPRTFFNCYVDIVDTWKGLCFFYQRHSSVVMLISYTRGRICVSSTTDILQPLSRYHRHVGGSMFLLPRAFFNYYVDIVDTWEDLCFFYHGHSSIVM